MDAAFQRPQGTAECRLFKRDKPGHWLTSLRNNDFLPGGGFFYEAGKMGLGGVNINCFHKLD